LSKVKIHFHLDNNYRTFLELPLGQVELPITSAVAYIYIYICIYIFFLFFFIAL